jgi:peroxiredoxin
VAVTSRLGSSLIVQLLVGILIGAALALIVLVGFPGEETSKTAYSTAITNTETISNETDLGEIAPVVGAMAPNFQLQDVNGDDVAITDFEGNVIMLNFWATWCAPCRLEMPLLEQHFREFADERFVILAINLQESAREVNQFVQEIGMTFPVLMDPDGRVAEMYRIIGYPSTILIDPTGRIRAIHIGILTEPQLREYLAQAGLST